VDKGSRLPFSSFLILTLAFFLLNNKSKPTPSPLKDKYLPLYFYIADNRNNSLKVLIAEMISPGLQSPADKLFDNLNILALSLFNSENNTSNNLPLILPLHKV
jgi:hypothetical protein